MAEVKPPQPRRFEYTTWTEEEASRFLSRIEAVDETRGPACALALLAALREGEVIGLRWRDVTLDGPEPQLRVVQAVATDRGGELRFGPPKTAASSEPVGLNRQAVDLLRRQRDRQILRLRALPVFVFDDGFGEPLLPRTLRAAFRRASRRLRLPPIRFHDLRHTAATLARRAGVGIEEVAEMMRHADAATTFRHYSHVLPDRKRAAVEALDRILGDAV